MINNKCPLCNARNYLYLKKYIKGSNIQKSPAIVECENCGHIFTLIESEVDERLLYQEGVYKVVDIRGSVFDRILTLEHYKILKRINRYFPQRGSLLDFGCGKGNFLQLARSNQWYVKGVETSIPRANYGGSVYKLDIFTENYEKGKINGAPFCVITFFHVLEHLYNPKQLLLELVNKNLKKGGLVVIEAPNFNSLQSKISGKGWLHLDLPRHISHFKEEKLEELISCLNLRTIKREYFSFHLGVLGMIQSLMQLFGYRKGIIAELKFKRSFLLVLSILFVFSWAFIMELFSSFFKKGGIIRIYAMKD